MKKIALFFLAFSGIYSVGAQDRVRPVGTDSLLKTTAENPVPEKKDTFQLKDKPSMRLFPNPAVNKVEMEIKGFEPGYVQVQLTDLSGNLVKQEKRSVFVGNEVIVLMFSVKAGAYFVLARQGKKQVRSKLIVR